MLKLVSSTFLALTLFTATAGAEEASGERGDKGDRFLRMQQKLDLSDEQVERMRQIRENGGSREDIRAVLTDEQREKAKSMRKGKGKGTGKGKHKGKGKAHGKHRDRPKQDESQTSDQTDSAD